MITPRSRARQKARVVSIRSRTSTGRCPDARPARDAAPRDAHRRARTHFSSSSGTMKMFPPFALASARHRSPLSSSNPLTCAFAMMPSKRDAANTKPTRPAPMMNPATSFAGGNAALAVGRASAPGRRPRAGRARARRSHRNARRVHVAVTSPEVLHRRRLSTRRPDSPDARPTERRRRSRETLLKEGRLRPRPSPHFTRAAALPRVLLTRHRRLTPLAPPRWPDSATWRASVPRSPIATAAGRKRETTPTTRILTCVPANPRVSA